MRDRASSAGEELPLPLTIEAAVQSRLDHLPRAEKDLAKRVSIFRRPFSEEELAALSVPNDLLRALVKKGIISARARSSGSTREYWFKSPLVAEVAYRMIADEHRRA